MALVRAVAIFCEDIRAERSGQDILIGTMSDNLALPGAPVFSAALSEPGLRVVLARAAADLNYLLLVPSV